MSKLESSEAISRASGLPGETISPSIAAMSRPRPKAWLEIEPPEVNLEWSEHMHETVILCSWESLVSTPMTRGSILPALMSATPTSSSTMFLFSSSASPSGVGLPPLPSWPSVEGSTSSAATVPGGAGPPAAGAAGATAAGAGAAGGGCGGVGGVLEEGVGFVEAELVAAAELFGGAFDVGDPFAELAGVVDRLAAGEALVLDAFGGVEEPVDLLFGVVGEAGVLAFPDRDAHLEVAERVGVAEVRRW